MRLIRLATVAVSVLICLGATPMQDAPTTTAPTQSTEAIQPPPGFEEAVAGLDAADYTSRQAAAGRLFELLAGRPELWPLLERVGRGHASPEVRVGAVGVLTRLTEHRLLGETRITLQVRDVHPRQLISELGRQSGVRFDYWPDDPWQQGGAVQRNVSLDLQDVPFWDAVMRVAEITGLAPFEHQASGPGRLILSSQGNAAATTSLPSSRHGAFVTQLRRLQMNESVATELAVGRDGRIAANATSHRVLQLEMRLLIEPKLQLWGGAGQPIIEEAVDERGRSLLLPQNDNARSWSQGVVPWSVVTHVMLDASTAKQSQSIARLRGKFDVEVALERESPEIRLADVADFSRMRDGQTVRPERTYTAGPHRLQLISISRPSEQMLQVEFAIRSEGVGGNDGEAWMRLMALGQALGLEDAQGQRWAHNGDGSPSVDDGALKVTRTFMVPRPGVGPPHRLVWDAPTRTARVEIPFEFTEIPLPKPE